MHTVKRIFLKISAVLKARPWYVGGGAVAIVAVLWFMFGHGAQAPQTFVLTRGDFIQSVSLSGSVTPAHTVELGFAQGGRVTGVYVSVGQTVWAGTLLAQVENGDLRATVAQRQAALETQEAKLASLRAGTRPEEIAVAQAIVVQDEASLRDAIADAHITADDAVHNTTDQFFTSPRIDPKLTFQTEASIANATEFSRLEAESALASWQQSLERDTVDVSAAARDARAAINRISSLLGNASDALSRATPDTHNTQSTLASYSSDVSVARTSVSAALGTINSAVTKLATDRQTLALKQAGAMQADIDAQAAQVKAAQADVDAARANLAKTIITAPFSGVVTRVDAKTGAIAGAGASQVGINSSGTFHLESYVPEIHIAKLKTGQQATITLDAYGDDVPFEATVVSIDPAQTLRDGVSTYRAMLQFDKVDNRIRAGMTANITITTSERQGVLSVPQGAIVTRDGQKFVTLQVGDSASERMVSVGDTSSRGEVEILSGLSEGDVVVLSPAQ